VKPLRALLKTSRPVSWVNTAYPFAAGYVVATGHANWPLLVVGTCYFLVPYNVLMYGINDVFDYESDRRNPRKGGVQGAVLDQRVHQFVIWASIVLNAPFVAWLLLRGNLASAVVLLIVLADVIAYSAPVLRFKERPFLDSASSSLHFVGPLLFALALAGFPGAARPVVLAFFLWGMASHAFGAVQDIAADRAAGIGSVATVIGARRTVRLAAGLYAAASAILLAHTPSAWPVALCGLLYIASVAPYWHITDHTAEQAQAGWKRFMWLNWVTGFVLTVTLLVHVH